MKMHGLLSAIHAVRIHNQARIGPIPTASAGIGPAPARPWLPTARTRQAKNTTTTPLAYPSRHTAKRPNRAGTEPTATASASIGPAPPRPPRKTVCLRGKGLFSLLWCRLFSF